MYFTNTPSLNSMEAVSYTHLDVYKRQLIPFTVFGVTSLQVYFDLYLIICRRFAFVKTLSKIFHWNIGDACPHRNEYGL